MGKEKEYFRDIFTDILQQFNNKKFLNLKEVSEYLNMDMRTVIKYDLPFKQANKCGNIMVSSVALARWLSE